MTPSTTKAFETQKIEKKIKKTTTNLAIPNPLHPTKSSRLHSIYRDTNTLPHFLFIVALLSKNFKKPSRNRIKGGRGSALGR